MALNVRHPVWLVAAPGPSVRTFSILFLVETMARASLTTVVPLQAYELIGDEQAVSFLYTAVGIAALAASFAIPQLIHRFARRWTYTVGAVALILACLCLYAQTVPAQAAGMFFRVFGTSCLNITLNLYVMEFIRKTDYVRYDSTRLALATVGWASAPTIGVLLYSHYGPGAVYGWSVGWAAALLALFWYLRLSDNRVIRAGRLPPANPLSNIRRFARQPRLRLAWLIAFGRSTFWVTFFVYVPITLVAAGKSETAAAYVVSAGNAVLISTLLWQRLNGRIGTRNAITLSFLLLAAALAGAGLTATPAPWAMAGFTILASVAGAGLDALGAVPFYRAVHAYERPEMTAVYRTYMDVSELLPLFVYGLLLGLFPLGAVWLAAGALALVCAAISYRHLPRRL